ncbi:MAG: DUF1501 domain-containing protein [Planctomycetaceae bacterium]|nr:DUF1501 domain-containing protein [Planctomycetaceae bacterium]
MPSALQLNPARVDWSTPGYLVDRRTALQVGAAGVVGTTLPFAAGPAAAATGSGRAKSVLLVVCSGGPSQLEVWDPKPSAPVEVRGDFSAISTAASGVMIGEHMPRLAQQLGRWSILRTLKHVEGNHLLAMHVALTGRPTPIPRSTASDLDRVESRHDFPNFAAALDFVRPRTDGIPTGVTLPNYFIEGPLTWPGQHAGFLGARHDPWQINQDPNDPKFKVDVLNLPADVAAPRLVSRRSLLESVNHSAAGLATARTTALGEQYDVAFSLLSSDRVAKAFDIQQESPETRDRYGRHKFGQSLLLARRLVEAGVPLVQAAMGIVQTWDTHVDNWGRLKSNLLPPLDQGLAALMDDLTERGLLDETLVIVMGEFGRTPKVSTLPGQTVPGRDHWPYAYSALFAGAGVRGGQVIGQTDASAAYPVSRAWSPADVCTTIFDALGVSHDAAIMDPLGRPNHLLNGEVIEPLYSGRNA